jgi:outer membrane lipoprotein-sorting protein
MRAVVIFVVAAVMATLAGPASALTGEQIVRNALSLHEGIRDYKALLTVTTDIEGLDMPERKVTVYFKRPDRVRMDSDGVVFIPKSALNLAELEHMISKNADSVLSGQKQVNGRTQYFVKMIPRGDQPHRDRVLLWVWGDNWTVDRLEMWYDGTQMFTMRWTYQRVGGKYLMPQSLVFTTSADRLPGGKRGQVRLQFSQVQVNLGLKDELFAQQK